MLGGGAMVAGMPLAGLFAQDRFDRQPADHQVGGARDAAERAHPAVGAADDAQQARDWLLRHGFENDSIQVVGLDDLALVCRSVAAPVNALADFAQQAMNSYVEIQKRWLDMATQLPIFGTKDKK